MSVGVPRIGRLLERMRRSRRFRLRYRPMDAVEVAYVLAACLAVGDVTVLVEEVSQLCGVDAPGDVRREFRRFVRLARHRNVRLVATSQRPADVDKLLVAESEVWLGRFAEPNDRRYLRDLGLLDRDDVDRLLLMPDWHYLDVRKRHLVRVSAAGGVMGLTPLPYSSDDTGGGSSDEADSPVS